MTLELFARRKVVDSPPGETKLGLLLSIVNSAGTIRGKTKLFKLVYITQEECKKAKVELDFYGFHPLYYGPFSLELEKDLISLEKGGYIMHEKATSAGIEYDQYTITDEGANYLRQVAIPEPATRAVDKVVQKYKDYPLSWLLRVVHAEYPTFLSNRSPETK